MVTKIPVREVMTRKVITIDEGTDAQDASKRMLENDIGSLIVLDSNNKPIGILTERDLVRKVISQDKSPSSVKAKEIMTKPLITISPDIELNEAVRKMRDLEVKKLPVVEKDDLVGIITESDILSISPALNEIFEEVSKINSSSSKREIDSWTDTGICENCGNYSEDLKAFDGNLLCEQCRNELEVGD